MIKLPDMSKVNVSAGFPVVEPGMHRAKVAVPPTPYVKVKDGEEKVSLRWTFVLTEGEQKGVQIQSFTSLDEKNTGFKTGLKAHLRALGLNDTGGDFDEQLAVGHECILVVVADTYQGKPSHKIDELFTIAGDPVTDDVHPKEVAGTSDLDAALQDL